MPASVPQPPVAEPASQDAPPSEATDKPINSPLTAEDELIPAAPEAGPEPEPQNEAEQDPDPSTPPSEPSTDNGQQAENDPLLRMTLMDFTHERTESVAEDRPDALEHTIDDLQRKPWRRSDANLDSAELDQLDAVDTAAYEEPSFVKQGRRKQRIGRVLRVAMVAGSVLLLLGLLLQSAYVFRNQIAAWFPQTKPILIKACAYIGCQVGLPAQIEAVSIESSELQAMAADSNSFSFAVLLRNHGATEQAWPNIELTLNDANDKAIARRVFTPRDYLPSAQEANQGFAPKSEQPIKLFFEVSQLKPSGYRVYLFYP